MADWNAYACNISTGKKWAPGDASCLDTIYHVVHLPVARRILEDGCLRAGLIHDESKLNRSRICVTWLSANTWSAGSIYGDVQFAFNWADVVRGRSFYWVEAMTDYTPTAYRLLLTDRDLSSKNYVVRYDPQNDDGPLRQQGDKWFWNSDFTSEFMVESDIPLSLCTQLRFIQHNLGICRTYGAQCRYKKTSFGTTGAQLLSYILGSRLDSANHALIRKSNNEEKLTDEAQHAVDGIWRKLGKKKDIFKGSLTDAPSCGSILRGALMLHGFGQADEAKTLISLLKSQEIFEATLASIVRHHFDFSSYTLSD